MSKISIVISKTLVMKNNTYHKLEKMPGEAGTSGKSFLIYCISSYRNQ